MTREHARAHCPPGQGGKTRNARESQPAPAARATPTTRGPSAGAAHLRSRHPQCPRCAAYLSTGSARAVAFCTIGFQARCRRDDARNFYRLGRLSRSACSDVILNQPRKPIESNPGSETYEPLCHEGD